MSALLEIKSGVGNYSTCIEKGENYLLDKLPQLKERVRWLFIMCGLIVMAYRLCIVCIRNLRVKKQKKKDSRCYGTTD